MDRFEAMLAAVRDESVEKDDAEIRERAARFLEDLDASSQVGMWFDAFAGSFASRHEAACAYVREVGARR